MKSSALRYLILLSAALLLMGGLPGCDARGGPSEPTIVITAPTSGAQFQVGQEVNILSSANDARGVIRVDLYVDGQLYRTDPNSELGGETGLAMFQTWVPNEPGTHTLSVIAVDVDGVESDPWAVTVTVVDESVTPSPSPTTGGASPPSATSTAAPPPPTATAPPPTPTQTPGTSDAPAIHYFHANGTEGSITVDAGATVTLSWEWERVTEGYMDPGNVGLACPAMPCTRNVSPGSNTTYTLRAVNASGTAEASVTVNVRAAATLGPDLTIENLLVTPANPYVGSSAEAVLDVVNVGDEPSGPFAVLWKWGPDDSEVCEWERPSLAPGGRETLRCTAEIVRSPYLTQATVDWRDEVDETDDDNNSMDFPMGIMRDPTKPDLFVTEILFDPSPPQQGSLVTVRVGIYNRGESAAGFFVVSWISGQLSGGCDWRVTSLAPDGERWQECTYTYTANGRFETSAVVDADGDVDEGDETNNEYAQAIDVQRP